MSGDTLRVSGKRFTLPESASRDGWKFEPRPGGWWIAVSPEGRRMRMAGVERRGKLGFCFPPEGSLWGDVIAKSHASGAGGAASAAQIAAELTAQFPGKVRKILVAAGAKVASGDSLLLIEAMKMEFAIRAPAAGRVSRFRVKEGQQLQPGDQLVDFEPETGTEREENGR